jgi:hypothetical protein
VQDSFEQLYAYVSSHGHQTTTRNGNAKQVLAVSWKFDAGEFVRRSKDNPAIGLIEGLQFIAGTSSLDAVAAAAPGARLELFGANSFYGPRTCGQFANAIDLLRKDTQTRRSVVTVARPDEGEDTLPCTLSLQFSVMNRFLHTHVAMRSSDLVWGAPYDMVQFGMVAMAVASCVGLEAYQCTVHTGNAHIYDSTAVSVNAWVPAMFSLPVMLDEWADWQNWAKGVVAKKLSREELARYFCVEYVV